MDQFRLDRTKDSMDAATKDEKGKLGRQMRVRQVMESDLIALKAVG
jgi:hypothetical protein